VEFIRSWLFPVLPQNAKFKDLTPKIP